jgi:hypothetical protein
MNFRGTLCFLDNSNKGKKREEKGRLLEYKIERHIERESAHLSSVFKWHNVIHLRVNQNVFILENFQSNGGC